jgi:hypothetical protein
MGPFSFGKHAIRRPIHISLIRLSSLVGKGRVTPYLRVMTSAQHLKHLVMMRNCTFS